MKDLHKYIQEKLVIDSNVQVPSFSEIIISIIQENMKRLDDNYKMNDETKQKLKDIFSKWSKDTGIKEPLIIMYMYDYEDIFGNTDKYGITIGNPYFSDICEKIENERAIFFDKEKSEHWLKKNNEILAYYSLHTRYPILFCDRKYEDNR